MASPGRLLLLVGYAGAIGLAVYELRHAPSLGVPPEPPRQVAQALPPLEVPPAPINSIAAYDAIIERPLFAPDRRAQTADEGAAPPGTDQPEEGAVEIDGFRLSAVLRDGSSTTVLVEDRTGQTRTLYAGDHLGNWQLDEILDDRVVLVADGRRETLLVYDFSAPVAAAAPVRRTYTRIPRPPRARTAPVERSAPRPSDQP